MKIAELRAALAEAETAFAGHEDVTAIGIGEKWSDGRNLREYALVFYVARKGEPAGELIPPTVNAANREILTDVRELPPDDCRLRNNRFDGGDILLTNPSWGRSGTLGYVAKEIGGAGRYFAITNSHVVAPPGKGAAGHSIYAFHKGARARIGVVTANTILQDGGRANPPDVALIQLGAGASGLSRPRWIEDLHKAIEGEEALSPAPHAASRLSRIYVSKAGGSRREETTTSAFELSNLAMKDTDPMSGDVSVIKFDRVFHVRIGGSVVDGDSGAVLTRLRSGKRVVSGLVVGGGGSNLFAFSFPDVQSYVRSNFGISF